MRHLVTTAVLGVLMMASPAHGAVSSPATVERLAKQATVAAYGQTVVWSRFDTSTATYRLVAADVAQPDAPARVLPVAPRKIAFDVDVGPGPDKEPLAVYSRCRVEPDGDYYGQKLWPNNAGGCDIYAYDFARDTERKLTNLSSPTADEYLPSIWKGTVAFARSYGTYNDRQWGDPRLWRTPWLYTHSLEGRERSRRQSQGSTRGIEHISMTGLDLYGRRLALTRRFAGPYDGGTNQMRVTTLESGSRLVAQRRSGLTQRILRSPQFHAGRVGWAEQCAADASGCGPAGWRFWRSRITVSQLTYADAPRWLASAAFILDSVWWVKAAPGYGVDNVNACQGQDPPDPNAACELQRAFVTFER